MRQNASAQVVRPATEGDRRQIQALLAEAFSLGLPSEAEPAPLSLEHRWVLADTDGVQATAVAAAGAQWFGGAPVACSLVRAVAVASPARGGGVGRELMRGVLAEQRARGLALSALFPSVPSPYRRVGYEYAGERQLMTAALTQVRSTSGPTPERLGLDGLEEIQACYEAWAASRPASLGRTESWWRDVVLAGDRTYLFGVREGGDLTGYVAYTKQAAVGHDLPYYFDIEVQDVAWKTRSAGLSLLTLLASHAGLGVSLRWPGHAGDLWARALTGQAPRVTFSYPWMLRVVDVSRALSERGYPAHVTASVAMSFVDDVLPDNANSYRLEVKGGLATVTPVAHASATIDVGAFAPLYTGYLSASELATEGRLTGASETELAALDSVFAGPRPLISELF